MSQTICLASENNHKIGELQEMLAPHGISVAGLKDFNITPNWVEDQDTFRGNALVKAKGCQSILGGQLVLSDDSGLVVPALDGAPGVHSSRYAGDQATDENNLQKLLLVMQDLKGEDRKAYFVCVLCLIDTQGKAHYFEGRCQGKIAFEKSGSHGFGYDPIFVPDGYEQSLASLPAAEKNSISHRRNALDAFIKGWIAKL